METIEGIHAMPNLQRAASEIGGNFPLDDAVIEAMPTGTRVISSDSFGASAWSMTARIDAETSEGVPVAFFLKCIATESGRAQVEGEFKAMSELRRTVPHLVPAPIGWGKFRLPNPPTYFFLIEFVHVSNRLPDPVQFGLRLAELHHKSVSPTGKFGFHITTYDGNLPHNVQWNDSWPDFFAKLLRSAYEHDKRANGVWIELDTLFNQVIDVVIPRLLGALEADGRAIKPCLVHGDLWEGNVGTEYNTGKIYIFDSCAYYAHNEMDLGTLSVDHHRLRAKAYKREYLRHFEASEPVNEWDDRIRLYSLKELFINSALFPGSQVRDRAYDTLSYLVQTFPASNNAHLRRPSTWTSKLDSNFVIQPVSPEPPDAIRAPPNLIRDNGPQQEGFRSLDMYTQANEKPLDEEVKQHREVTAPFDNEGAQRIPTKQSEESFGALDLNAQTDEQHLNDSVWQDLEETAPLDSHDAQRISTKQSEEEDLATECEITHVTSGDDDPGTVNDGIQTIGTIPGYPSPPEDITLGKADVKALAMTYSNANSDESTLKLVYSIRPEWEARPGPVNIVRFTDGIMNTVRYALQQPRGRPRPTPLPDVRLISNPQLLKIVKETPGHSDLQNDKEAILLRAYGTGSDILVDRDMEAMTHGLLAQRGLAAPLLARFQNGLLYGYLPGRVCTTQDLTQENVWRAIAARLGEWHARLPLPSPRASEIQDKSTARSAQTPPCIAGRSQSPNIWTVIQKWISVLPTRTEAEEALKAVLQKEMERSFEELDHDQSLGHHGYVLGHCDLLTANILLPLEDNTLERDAKLLKEEVRFIDYEYAVPCPAAFDLANHFAEWGGFECDYNLLPTKAVRRAFIEEYVESYSQYAPLEPTAPCSLVEDLLVDTDRYRGIPGLYWGIQALVQSVISDIDFDWPSYAVVRLNEYWAWREEVDGSRAMAGKEMPLREQKWTQLV